LRLAALLLLLLLLLLVVPLLEVLRLPCAAAGVGRGVRVWRRRGVWDSVLGLLVRVGEVALRLVVDVRLASVARGCLTWYFATILAA
jgi:hypothetical protein